MKNFKNSLPFLAPYGIFLFVGILLLFYTEKGDGVIWLNEHHSGGWDLFFKYATHLGDGIFIAIVIIAGFFWNRNFSVKGGILMIIVALVTQVLKRLVFEWPRPKAVLGDAYHFVEGVAIHTNYSFPSGHSSAAFCLYLLIAMHTESKRFQILCFHLALIVGVSRMYLFQHFLMDVVAGSVLGVVLTLVGYYLMTNTFGWELKEKKRNA